jgi:DNA-binding response OmpR family regulator
MLDRLVGRAPAPAPSPAPRVLVVEDDAVIRSLIAVTLSVEGFEVFEAADGIDALVMAATIEPDLVVLDATLPEISGCDVAQRLAAGPRSASLKVLQLDKPFEPETLVGVVRARLG